jgi:DNA-binding transcriptional LysR family regulator
MNCWDENHSVCALMSLNPTHLRTFLAVQKHANYTRAAQELFLTQPAVSRQIDQLEKELGVPLFEQIGKTIHLTEAGRALREDAERLLGDMERIAESVRALGSPERGRIAVGASTTPGLYLLPAVIGRFCQQFPYIEFHYTVENSRRIEQKVLGNELDLGFVGVAPTDSSIHAERILDDRIVFFASPTHSLAALRKIDFRQIAACTWIVREKGAATRQLVEKRLTRGKLKPSRVIEMNYPEGVKALVAAGVGLSFMSVHGLADDLDRGRLKVLDIPDFDLCRPIYVVRHRDKYVSPAMSEFQRLVAQTSNSKSPQRVSARQKNR